MATPITRREAIVRVLLSLPAASGSLSAAFSEAASGRLAALERKKGGRLGVAFIDVRSGSHLGHRADERFPMCSTFKLLAAARVLERVDRREERLDRRVTFSRDDLVTYSPVTGERTGAPGMTIDALCDAAMTVSDNTAANLLLASFGGPPALTAFVRSLGDTVTRLDRIEPELNEATPGDPRDTTTPGAAAENVRRLVLGTTLSADSRERLTRWLLANQTGDARLRAGFPAGWRVGDKTGSGEHGTTNDVAVAWRTDGSPIIVAAYYTESTLDGAGRNAVLAEVGRIVTGGF